MASTQIPMYKLEELADEMIKPLRDDKNKAIVEFEQAAMNFAIKQTPAEILKLYNDEKTRQYIKTRKSMYYHYKLKEEEYRQSIYFSFRNDKGKEDVAPFPSTMDCLGELIESTYSNAVAKEFYDRMIKINELQNDITKTRLKIMCALKTHNTPTKLKNEMPIAYKIYIEKIEKLEATKENGCDTAEEINALMSKYHK